jgi:hypothetical protein
VCIKLEQQKLMRHPVKCLDDIKEYDRELLPRTKRGVHVPEKLVDAVKRGKMLAKSRLTVREEPIAVELLNGAPVLPARTTA